MSAEILYATNYQKILNYLIQDPGRQFIASEIQADTKLSKAGVNAGLRTLVGKRMVAREKRGNIYFYRVEAADNPLIKQMKVMHTLTALQALIGKLKTVSKKIILFGSCGRGEDTPASDADLLVVTDSEYKVKTIAAGWRMKRKLQLVIKTPLAYVEMEKNDREFYEEVSHGLVLWEEKE